MTTKKDSTQAQSEFEHFQQFENDMSGFEDINHNTMAVPFIRIVQALSPQLKKTRPEYIADAVEGDIINTITKDIYEKPLRFVVGKFERVYIEWKPKRGGFVQALSPEVVESDPERYKLVNVEGRLKLIDMVTRNEVVDTYMYYILLADHPEDGVCILACSSSQLTQAKKLNRLLKTTMLPNGKRALPFFQVWTMDTTEMSKDGNDWVGIRFEFDGFVGQALLENVVNERKELPNKRVDYAALIEGPSALDDDDMPDDI